MPDTTSGRTPRQILAITTQAAEEHAAAGADWPDAVHHMIRSLIDRLAIARGLTPPALTRPDVPAADAALDELGPLDGWHVLDIGEVHQQLLELLLTTGTNGRTVARKKGLAARGDQGAWYTPPEVAAAMCRLSLGRPLDRLAHDPDPVNMLQVSAIDPACGAGVYLVEAARYIARRFGARLFGIAPEHVPEGVVDAALPDVIQQCIYGVDIDPVAVDLAKAALWMEISGRRPYDFLDQNIVVGNALELDLPPAYVERHGEPPTSEERRAQASTVIGVPG
jgi:hypothetical protein